MGLIEEMTPVAISLTSPISKITLLTGTTSLLSDHVPMFLDASNEDLNMIQEIRTNRLVDDDMMIQENVPKAFMSIGYQPRSISLPLTVAITDVDKGQIVAEVISLGKETIEGAIGHALKASVVVVAEKNRSKTVRSVFELEYVPLYGLHSVCGRRPEMEDAVASVPAFMKIPVKMLVGDRVINGVNSNLNELTAHFFGVYDGHGGCQVFLPLFSQLHSSRFIILIRFLIHLDV